MLTHKELKVRYKSSWLGYVWSLAHPLAFAAIYVIAFGIIMRIQIPNYPLFLIAGLFPWQWFSNSIGASPNIFLHNSTLIKKVQFPRHALVASTVLNDGIHFLVSVPVILVFVLGYGLAPTWSWIAGIPLLALAQFIMAYGFALVIASLNIFFRDLERLTVLFITFLFFLTPIIYTTSMIPSEYQVFMYLNPVTPLVLSWKQLFLSGTLNWPLIALVFLYSLASLGFGSLVYRRLSWKFAEVL